MLSTDILVVDLRRKILGHSRDAVRVERLPEELLGRNVSKTLQGECNSQAHRLHSYKE